MAVHGLPPPPLALWDVFRGKAEGAGAAVHLARGEAAAATLVAAAAGTPVATRSAALRFPGVAGRCRAAPPSAEAAAEVVVVAGLFAVAETGSVVVQEASAADRGTCWLAERLWLLVSATEIEPTLDHALARIARAVRDGAGYVTLMTGPSRTADIERTLTIGVHGPRALAVVVVGGGPET